MKKLLLLLLLPSLVWAQQVPQNYVYNPGAATPIQATPGAQSKQSTDGHGNSFVIVLTPIPVNVSGTPISVNTPTAHWPVDVSGTPISVNTPVPTPGTWVRVAIPAATVPSAYTPNIAPTPSITGLSNSSLLKLCRFNSTLNQPVSCSFDGTNDDVPSIPTNSTQWFDFQTDGVPVNTSIVCKATGTAPTSGSLYINCGK